MKRVRLNKEIRVNVLIAITIIVACIYAIRLFNLQIINGSMYREQSQKKILRSEKIEAARGEIYDRNGVVLASNRLGYDLNIYRVGLNSQELNRVIASIISILEKNNDKYYSTIPIKTIDDSNLSFSSTYAQNIYLDVFAYNEDLTAKQLLTNLYKKYELDESEYSEEMKYKISAIRYEISVNGFSLFNPAVIAKDISYNSMAYIEELGKELAGVQVKTTTKRVYQYESLCAHVLGYIGSINEEEYTRLKNDGYNQNSVVGKLGIEQFLEKYLKGTDGLLRTNVDALGSVNYEYIYKESISGKNVTLTIDYNLQKAAEEALKSTINSLQNGNMSSRRVYGC